MQGRLSPAPDMNIQFFPKYTWEKEFYLAQKAGLDRIEWIYEYSSTDPNPVNTQKGREIILDLQKNTGVCVKSICADYFMQRLLISSEGKIIRENVLNLLKLIEYSFKLDIDYIILPFVDSSSIKNSQQENALIEILSEILTSAEAHGIEIHLETDFEPDKISALLDQIDNKFMKMNYDIGNSASLGYSPFEELTAIGKRLGSVHIKDRVENGRTVTLGTGDADFKTCFTQFKNREYKGPYILQTARDEKISELDLARKNKRFVEDYLDKYQ